MHLPEPKVWHGMHMLCMVPTCSGVSMLQAGALVYLREHTIHRRIDPLCVVARLVTYDVLQLPPTFMRGAVKSSRTRAGLLFVPST